jgi:SAM-dependent methyltransferase
MRAALDAIRAGGEFAGMSLIRFSDDPIVEDRWFKSSEISLFEGRNSLDIQAIDRADQAYDVVVCSHVIEHVPDDRRAIRELTRIVAPLGFLLLAYPRSEEGDLTQDWGFADPAKNGHYRGYGSDFDRVVAETVPQAQTIAIVAGDPVTGDSKKFAIISKSSAWTERVLDRVPGARRISGRA